MRLLVKKLRPEAVLPRFAHPDDSGMDVCACEERVLLPGERAKIPLGLAFQPPPGTEIQLRPRSGLAIKHGISMVNTPATIDEGYRGEVCAILINHGSEPFRVEAGMRVAQIVVCPVLRPEVVEADDLSDTARGAGGFGSTGTGSSPGAAAPGGMDAPAGTAGAAVPPEIVSAAATVPAATEAAR